MSIIGIGVLETVVKRKRTVIRLDQGVLALHVRRIVVQIVLLLRPHRQHKAEQHIRHDEEVEAGARLGGTIPAMADRDGHLVFFVFRGRWAGTKL